MHLTRTVYLAADYTAGPLAEIAPDIILNVPGPDGEKVPLDRCVAFFDQRSREGVVAHVYAMTQDGFGRFVADVVEAKAKLDAAGNGSVVKPASLIAPDGRPLIQ